MDLAFFYGTLMRPFNRAGQLRVADHLVYVGRGSISGALFDLGIYPAAVPASDALVWGEVYRMTHPAIVLQVLDQFEGCRTEEPDSSLYTRALAPVTLEDGRAVDAWVYFYNAPLGRAERIQSGDYLEHMRLGTTD
ncbi:MAG: gamma-glutamylcyclotransferase [Acidobacteria bacterium]|nr:gamma-glutamylcyclotransferase [Acidobacteriota bacterium]